MIRSSNIARPFFLLTTMALTACSNSATGPAPGSDPALAVGDAALQALIAPRSAWTFYKNRPDTLSRASGSGHPEARLRTRYNAFAASQLDATGKVKAGAVFPDSSIIVKDLINGNTLVTVAVMMKLKKSPQASTAGWVWAEYGPTGGVGYATGNRGGSCAGCHSAGIDLTRMNDSHP